MPPLATAQSLDNDEISVGDESFCYAESSSSPEEAKKSVRIDLEQNDVCIIPPRSDLSSAEMAKVWYSRDESDAIKQGLLMTIARLNHAGSLNEDHESARGLEFFTYNGALKRECTKIRLYRSVLEEQERQRQASVCNAADLAHVAAHCTAGCAEFALGMAACDEDAVYNADDLLDKNRDDEDEALIKQALSMRPVLSLCCWDFGLSCFKSFR